MPASYSLGSHFEQFVRRQLRSGRFASASEVVRQGLRLMEEREAEREARLEALRAGDGGGRKGVQVEKASRPKRGRRGVRLDRDAVLKRLRAHEAELKAMGVKRLSLFGSVARGEAGPGSDVDLAAELDQARGLDLLDFAQINLHLNDLLGAKVDLVSEPARRRDFQAQIDRDRIHAF